MVNEKQMTDCIVLVLAAGTGSRTSNSAPKQYILLNRKAMLRRTVEIFLSHPAINAIHVVISKGHKEFYKNAIDGLDLPPPIYGGDTRQQSALKGLIHLKDKQPEYVLIHDAARPFVDHKLIDRVLNKLITSRVAIPGIRLTDTLKRVRAAHRNVESTINRKDLWCIQTPQGFHYQDILAAHSNFANEAASDDAAVAERAGLEIAVVDGNEQNFKITTDNDVEHAIKLFSHTYIETRIGSGFDVHPFCEGDHLYLCGVKINHDRALMGHSDADVAIHAVTDALLGGLGLGDIGMHFPSDEEKWRGAKSKLFLEKTKHLLFERGAEVGNIDITIICETPKINPYRERMTSSLAKILDIDTNRINIKATTTEKLGFLGRGEGIAAQASATIHLT